MDKPQQPHVIRTWAVDRLRAKAAPPAKSIHSPKPFTTRKAADPKRRTSP